MEFVLTRDADTFAVNAEAFLADRVERNVLATLLVNIRNRGFGSSTPLFAYGTRPGGAVVGAALRIPPWSLLVSDLDEAAANALITVWLPADAAVPGVSGPIESVRAVSDAWVRRTGGRARCRMRQAMHLLAEVKDPERPAAGRLRQATDAERDLLIEWERAFALEAGTGQVDQSPRVVDGRLARGAQFVWDDDGPVSTLAISPAIAGTVRIGPVYTPPEHRRRGYASSAVAAAARHALETGARQCVLFTDLANPTSNKIYAAIGFRHVADFGEYSFETS